MLFATLARILSIYRNSERQICHRQSNRQLRKELYRMEAQNIRCFFDSKRFVRIAMDW